MSSLEQDLIKFVSQHHENGIFLDTNVLLLYIFSIYQPTKIGTKRLEKYMVEDGELLVGYIGRFNKVLTTPHILAETSNLARQISKSSHWQDLSHKLYSLFCSNNPDGLVRIDIQKTAININLFTQLGLTDSYIAALTNEKRLLLTDDLDLYVASCLNGGDAINFTHMREAAGTID